MNLLDLSKCEGEEIFIGDFYNDICYTYTNSKGTDVTLNDRKNEYINNNKSY